MLEHECFGVCLRLVFAAPCNISEISTSIILLPKTTLVSSVSPTKTLKRKLYPLQCKRRRLRFRILKTSHFTPSAPNGADNMGISRSSLHLICAHTKSVIFARKQQSLMHFYFAQPTNVLFSSQNPLSYLAWLLHDSVTLDIHFSLSVIK